MLPEADLLVQSASTMMHNPTGRNTHRATVLVVAGLLNWYRAAHTDGASAVCNAPAEVVHGAGLVLACQAALVALACTGNVYAPG